MYPNDENNKYWKWEKCQFQLQINWKFIILIYIYYSQQTLFIISKESTTNEMNLAQMFFFHQFQYSRDPLFFAGLKAKSKLNYDESYYALNFGYIKIVRSNHVSN